MHSSRVVCLLSSLSSPTLLEVRLHEKEDTWKPEKRLRLGERNQRYYLPLGLSSNLG